MKLKLIVAISALSLLAACAPVQSTEFDIVEYNKLFESCLDKAPAESQDAVKQCRFYAHEISTLAQRNRKKNQ